ncbi:MAG: alkaline phosphatase family protein [Firmicutes bacterium]|nr:alkaline phosphatase family protein [Bacillota bacterium]
MDNHKKVILIIIDSFHPGVLESCFRQKLVPALSFLKERGFYTPDCISVFPTMTPTATSSVITGTAPAVHQVVGFNWFSRAEKRIVNYGSSRKAVFTIGVRRVVHDLLYNLNHRHQKAETVYELAEAAGLSTAAVNTYIFRGGNERKARIPFLMRLYSRFELNSIRCRCPGVFYLGRLCKPKSLKGKLALLRGYPGNWGINDEYSGRAAACA